MLDTENNPNELGKIKQNFVNSLYDEKTYFGRYYTTINDLVGELDPDKEFDQDLHYFRNTINEDIAPKSLDEMRKINALLPEDQRWQILDPFLSLFHMFGEGGEFNTKFVLGTGQHFEAVYDGKGNGNLQLFRP